MAKRTSLLLIFSFLIATLGVYSYIRFRPVGPAEIFLVETPVLTEGDIELSGYISRDAPPDQPGTYYLTLEDNRLVELDTQDLADLLGTDVTIAGDLVFLDNSPSSPFLIVNSITVGQ